MLGGVFAQCRSAAHMPLHRQQHQLCARPPRKLRATRQSLSGVTACSKHCLASFKFDPNPTLRMQSTSGWAKL
eukprot:5198209-Pleurochrysis_carterae.AAC.1